MTNTKPGRPPADTTAAKQFLLECLSDGPIPLKELRRAADAAGITDMDLMRARNAMGLKPKQVAVTRVLWCLALPNAGAGGVASQEDTPATPAAPVTLPPVEGVSGGNQ